MKVASVPRLLALGILVLVGPLTGCSKSDSEKVEDTVKGYLSAFSEGDGDAACDYLTTEGRLELVALYETTLGGIGVETAQCQTATEEIASNVGADTLALLEGAEVAVRIDGSKAYATPSSDGNEGNEITLEKVDGDWLITSGFLD